MTKEQRATAKESVDKAINLIETCITEERMPQFQTMLEEIGERYFLAPASGRLEHHSAFAGGLITHSVNVTMLINKLIAVFTTEYSSESCAIVGLFHDLGKIGSIDGTPYYVKQTSDWHREKLGQMYKNNEDLNDSMGVAQRSLRILQYFGVELTDSEYISILYHDGLYVEENRIPQMMYSQDPLMRITHMADSYSALVMKI